ISGDPDETAAPLTIEHVGAHCFLWATDYPHPDHPSTWVRALELFGAPPRPLPGTAADRRSPLPAICPGASSAPPPFRNGTRPTRSATCRRSKWGPGTAPQSTSRSPRRASSSSSTTTTEEFAL